MPWAEVRRWLVAPEARRWRLTATMFTLLVAFTARPIGTTGHGLVTLCLLVLNYLLFVVRLLPDEVITPVGYRVLVLVGVVAAAAMTAADTHGLGSLFASAVASNARGRLAVRESFVVAALTSVLCAGVVWFDVGGGHYPSTWFLAGLTGLTVLIGVANRRQVEALQAARQAAAQTELATRSQHRAAALAERARIARDVHDVLAHSLAGVNLQLEAVDALLEAGRTQDARQAARRAQSLVRTGLTEVQRTVVALREDALPLVETLQALAEGAAVTAGVEVRIDGTPRELPVRTSQALLRCAQEALTNAHKHAPDAAVRLAVGFTADRTTLEVVNAAPAGDGRPLAQTGGGMGLIGMRERVALVGGTVQAGPITSGADLGGWRVHVEVPG